MATIPPETAKIGPARDRRVWLERRAFELSRTCPVDQMNPVDCPLFGVRGLPARDRRTWINRLSDDELAYLATYHGCCYAVKIAGGAPGRAPGP